MMRLFGLWLLVLCGGESISDTFGLGQVVSWSESELILEEVGHWQRFLEPIGTVCVTGDDRVGKSTLLSMWVRNLTMNQDCSFPAGHTRRSHTKGMWSAILPREVTKLNYHLNLCDSQGLKQISALEQGRLFAANVLVPQVLVYIVFDVVQNNALHDLAIFAHQFQKLSNHEFGQLGRVSPHLIVVVREESDLGETADRNATEQLEEADCNATDHLEEVLANPDFAEDKALIKRVFRSREAWSLAELPKEARRALRSEGHLSSEAAAWKSSGEVVLQRVLDSLERRRSSFPRRGPELADWYQSVIETVNSREDGSLGRLIGHGEHLHLGRRLHFALQDWFGPALAILGVLGLLVAFGGVIRVWLDRLAWLAWIVLCICYLGGSPLIKTPLGGLLQRYCNSISLGAGEALVKAVCMEVSSQTAAIVLAAVLGALSYPVLMSRFCWLLGHLPLPSAWQQSLATWSLMLLILAAWRLQEAILEVAYGAGSNSWSLLGVAVLLISGLVSGLDLFTAVENNRRSALAAEEAMVLHSFIAQRDERVADLEVTDAWAAHYSRHAPRDAIWRYRSRPTWPSASNLTQVCGLLAWALLIHPSCDVVFVVGVAANLLHLAWLGSAALTKRRNRKEPIEEWLDELEDCSADEDASTEVSSSSETPRLPAVEETEEEVQLRERIEAMREEQEKGPVATKRRRSSSIPGKRLSF